MTITVYTAKYSEGTDRLFTGTVSWDKNTPRQLDAKLCPHLSPNEVDYPVWSESAPFGRTGLQQLITAMQEQSKKMGMKFLSEHETRFAVRDSG